VLTFGLGSAKDLYEKLDRDEAILDREVTSDAFFNFVVTGYSLVDWIKNDPAVPALAKTKSQIDALYADRWIRICGDLATASKHFTLSQRVPINGNAHSKRGFGLGRYGKGGYGVGEESITIQLNDGTTFTALALVRGVLFRRRRSDMYVYVQAVDTSTPAGNKGPN
jgi:hypothetical protein